MKAIVHLLNALTCSLLSVHYDNILFIILLGFHFSFCLNKDRSPLVSILYKNNTIYSKSGGLGGLRNVFFLVGGGVSGN